MGLSAFVDPNVWESHVSAGSGRVLPQAKASAALALAALAVALASLGSPSASAQSSATLVQVIDTSAWDPPSPDPSGITYDTRREASFVVDGEVEETPHWDEVNVWLVTTAGETGETWSIAGLVTEPNGVDIVGSSTMWLTDDVAGRVFRWRTGADGDWGTDDDRLGSFSTKRFGSQDPEGITIGGGHMFVVDGTAQEIFVIGPGDNGRFDGVGRHGDDEVTSFDTAGLGLDDPEGAVYDRNSGDLLVVSRRNLIIARVTIDGDLVSTADISTSGILRPSDVTLAPGSNDPSQDPRMSRTVARTTAPTRTRMTGASSSSRSGSRGTRRPT